MLAALYAQHEDELGEARSRALPGRAIGAAAGGDALPMSARTAPHRRAATRPGSAGCSGPVPRWSCCGRCWSRRSSVPGYCSTRRAAARHCASCPPSCRRRPMASSCGWSRAKPGAPWPSPPPASRSRCWWPYPPRCCRRGRCRFRPCRPHGRRAGVRCGKPCAGLGGAAQHSRTGVGAGLRSRGRPRADGGGAGDSAHLRRHARQGLRRHPRKRRQRDRAQPDRQRQRPPAGLLPTGCCRRTRPS